MDTCYEELGLSSIINASGRMSKLGVSIIDDEVRKALGDAAQNYVYMDDLMVQAGKAIAKDIGCKDVCVCSCASSAIVLAIASIICGDNENKVKHFHQSVLHSEAREVILLKGQNINYGAPIDEMIYLGGGLPVEVGYANECYLDDIAEAINKHTIAILYVKSHHCVQKNMVSIEEVITLANERNIPCIIDASAEEDLSIYHDIGADIVCYAGTKAISGPTSGFAACKSERYAEQMRLQYKGIGRAMKIGKENILGLVKAVSIYKKNGGYKYCITYEDLQQFTEQFHTLNGIEASLIQDESGRSIYRCRLHISKEFVLSPKEVVVYLESYSPAIYTRNYEVNLGYVVIDPRGLKDTSQLQCIFEAFKSMLALFK